MNSVHGKVVFLTGGAGGIGMAMTEKLLECGVKGISIVDISEEAGQKIVKEISSKHGENKITFIKADITVKKELEDAFETTIKIYNQLDIVINNAGIVNEKDWKATIATNLVAVIDGTYLAMQKYLPKYKSGEEGIIVNTASILGLESIQVCPIYCTTKHALIGFGKALGGDEFYNKYKVRVLTMCPGLVRTTLTVGQELCFPHRAREEFQAIGSCLQLPECVGEALIEIIKRGKSGSLWITENDEPVYEAVVPHRKTMKVEN